MWGPWKSAANQTLNQTLLKYVILFLHTWYTDMRCMYNLFRVYWTNIEDRKILVLKALQDIFDDCQRCIETTSPWLDIAFPLSHPPVKLQIGPHVISSRRDSEASENLIAMATSCHIERTKHDALSPPCSKIRWTITRYIDHESIWQCGSRFLLLWRQVCAFEFPGSQQSTVTSDSRAKHIESKVEDRTMLADLGRGCHCVSKICVWLPAIGSLPSFMAHVDFHVDLKLLISNMF